MFNLELQKDQKKVLKEPEAKHVFIPKPSGTTSVRNSFQALEPVYDEGDLDILNVDEAEWPKCQVESAKVEKPKMKKIERKSQKKRRQITFEDEPQWESCGQMNFLDVVGGELSNVSQNEELEWIEVKSVVDSGATKCVAPRSLADQIPIQESEASRRGLSFQGAGGENPKLRDADNSCHDE